jgi:trimeric autotransporter adhesin
MRQVLVRLAAVALLLSTAACGSGDGPDYIWLRAMHAMPDSPAVRVSFENYVFQQDVAFGLSTREGGESLLSEMGSTARLTAEYRQHLGAIGGTLLEADVPVVKDSSSTVIFAGTFDAPETITVVTPRLQRPLAAINLQFAHAALDLGAIDIYITAPDTELTATAPVASLQPRAHTGNLEVPFGKTRIRLTPAGSLDVLMDSGELDFPQSDASTGPGMQWLFAVAPSAVAGPSPVLLIGSTGRESFRFLDAGTPAALRAMHASPDAPPVDLRIADPAGTLFQGLEYRARSPLLPGPTGEDLVLEFRDSGSGELFAESEEDLFAGEEYSLFLVDELEDARVVVDSSSTRSIASEAKLRFANLAPAASFFTFYLTETEDEERSPDKWVIRDLRFGVSSGHVRRAPGNYFLTITERFFETQEESETAIETVVHGPLPLELVGGDVLTYVLFAPETEGEPEILQLFDDRLP